MGKLEAAINILKSIGASKKILNERSGLTLLALANISPGSKFRDAREICLGIVGTKSGVGYPGIMQFMSDKYGKVYAENSRETIRRSVIHEFLKLGIVVQNKENPSLPTNSSKNHYSLTPEFIKLVSAYNSPQWNKALDEYLSKADLIQKRNRNVRALRKLDVTLPNGEKLKLSPGDHNELQARIIESFIPEFATSAKLLYCGDTANKYLYVDIESLERLGIDMSKQVHSKLPDVVLYDNQKDWLYLIEAVTSHGPINDKRMYDFDELLKNCNSGKIFVTAFLSLTTFRKYANEIAWESEVWIAENPKHMIHFNGDRFLGPR
jgi:hypothetical protein